MATREHLELSNYIKNVHKSLRDDSNSLGFDRAWRKHRDNKEIKKKYAVAMKTLATEYWDSNDASNSRILWTVTRCKDYFLQGGIVRHRAKEQAIYKKINGTSLTCQSQTWCDRSIIDLLDVGSCYNPFKTFPCFKVCALDIAPADADVHDCDFLNINISDRNSFHKGNVLLQRCSFDVVVFSLFLEYFPSPEKRLECCKNAYGLLKPEGLLIIITPDSSHVGVNAKLIKSWRFHLARLGFSRIVYEKLEHLHCMVFRKTIDPEVAKRWARIYEGKEEDAIYIPQDFRMSMTTESTHIDVDTKIFLELPNYVEL